MLEVRDRRDGVVDAVLAMSASELVVPSSEAGEPQKRLASAMSMRVARMLLLEQAAALVGGHDRLAAFLGIQARSLRAKFSADRGISDGDLEQAALALEARVAELQRLAGKIRAVLA